MFVNFIILKIPLSILLLIISCEKITEPLDCTGVVGGDAIIDECGICGGMGAVYECGCYDPIENYDCNWNDCNGDYYGDAIIDNCNNCVGGNTDDTACVQDCTGAWGGDAVEDDCGVCGGDNSPLTGNCDCHGTPNGQAYTDGCGACVGGLTEKEACANDCLGVLGGDAVVDNCGVCGGDNSPLTGNCDCHGTPNGQAYTDGCGACVGGLTEKEACANDCLGVLGGDAVYDNCNTCDNDPENDCLQDCAGTWGGDAQEDSCGVCDSDSENDNTPSTGTCDCEGTPDGTAIIDNCGTCDADASNDCIQDCADTWGGDAQEDSCGVCDSDSENDNTPSTGTCDCEGTPDGTAIIDNCGVCDNDVSNDCAQDCAGAWGGDAVEDDCGICDNDSSNNCMLFYENFCDFSDWEQFCEDGYKWIESEDDYTVCEEGWFMCDYSACMGAIYPFNCVATLYTHSSSYNRFATFEISHQVVAGQTISFKYNISGLCGYTDPNGKELNKIELYINDVLTWNNCGWHGFYEGDAHTEINFNGTAEIKIYAAVRASNNIKITEFKID